MGAERLSDHFTVAKKPKCVRSWRWGSVETYIAALYDQLAARGVGGPGGDVEGHAVVDHD
jgi:hypothetical protein